MARKMTEWPSKRGPPSKIWLSDRCGERIVLMVVGYGYGRSGFEGCLGNVGSNRTYHVLPTLDQNRTCPRPPFVVPFSANARDHMGNPRLVSMQWALWTMRFRLESQDL